MWTSWFKIIKPSFQTKDVELTGEAKSQVKEVLKRKNAGRNIGSFLCFLRNFGESFSVIFCCFSVILLFFSDIPLLSLLGVGLK